MKANNKNSKNSNEEYEDFICFAAAWSRSYEARKKKESLLMEKAKKRLTDEDYQKIELLECPVEEYVRINRPELLMESF